MATIFFSPFIRSLTDTQVRTVPYINAQTLFSCYPNIMIYVSRVRYAGAIGNGIMRSPPPPKMRLNYVPHNNYLLSIIVLSRLAYLDFCGQLRNFRIKPLSFKNKIKKTVASYFVFDHTYMIIVTSLNC